jgi:hypothetical protein
VIIEMFSQRQERLSGAAPDIFTYDSLPPGLRVQIVRIWDGVLGAGSTWDGRNFIPNTKYDQLTQVIATEFGLFNLCAHKRGETQRDDLVEFFVKATAEQALDMIDLTFGLAPIAHQDRTWKVVHRIKVAPDTAIAELNDRFMQHGVGYAFVNGELLRKDSEHLHREAVVPALNLLQKPGFEGPNEEYRAAHEHYRHGRYKDCLTNCLKAFESTMKGICAQRGWPFQSSDTASTLIKTCLDNGLVPAFLHGHFGALQALLSSGIPTVRNRLGGHGQGPNPVEVPRYIAEYLLHQTATTITLLSEANTALP